MTMKTTKITEADLADGMWATTEPIDLYGGLDRVDLLKFQAHMMELAKHPMIQVPNPPGFHQPVRTYGQGLAPLIEPEPPTRYPRENFIHLDDDDVEDDVDGGPPLYQNRLARAQNLITIGTPESNPNRVPLPEEVDEAFIETMDWLRDRDCPMAECALKAMEHIHTRGQERFPR